MIALLTALEIVLSRFLSISMWNIKIGFSFVPVVLAALLLGPLGGALVAALGDFVGAMLFPIGPYFPGFTVSALLTGLVYGLFLYRKATLPKVVASVCITQLGISLFLSTLWISMLYGTPYIALLPTRLGQAVLMTAVQILVIPLLATQLLPVLQKMRRKA